MKYLGQILLWLGFLAGALATVFNADSKGIKFVKGRTAQDATEGRYELPDLSAVAVPEDGWQLIPWAWYIPAALVCVVGIVLIRIGKSSETEKSEKTSASLDEIKNSMKSLIEKLDRLSKESDVLAPSKITLRIDNELADDLRVFADGRNSITAEYGLDIFADVMTQFAAGERSVNRAWSAASDGYVDEAATCIERAGQLMREAQRKLEEAR